MSKHTMIAAIRSSSLGASAPWKEVTLIENERVTLINMVPGIITGWNFGRVTVQGADDWPGMSAEQILAWKTANGLELKILPDHSGFVGRAIKHAESVASKR